MRRVSNLHLEQKLVKITSDVEHTTQKTLHLRIQC